MKSVSRSTQDPRQSSAAEPLAAALRSRGLRVTPQRLLIEEALRRIGRHATAEEVRRAVADRLPHATAPTVYATLELLAELGRVRKVRAGRGPLLFDPRVDRHAHFVCSCCGAVFDLPAQEPAEIVDPAPALAAARAAGHQPEAAEVVVEGRCARCLRQAR